MKTLYKVEKSCNAKFVRSYTITTRHIFQIHQSSNIGQRFVWKISSFFYIGFHSFIAQKQFTNSVLIVLIMFGGETCQSPYKTILNICNWNIFGQQNMKWCDCVILHSYCFRYKSQNINLVSEWKNHSKNKNLIQSKSTHFVVINCDHIFFGQWHISFWAN